MPVTFIHTADWQLGKPFARVEDVEKRTLIRQARLDAIDRIGDAVRERKAAFVVVAGDLFDTPTASQSTVSQACSAIGRLEVPVFVIPGNHDHGGPGCLWEQSFFRQEQEKLAPNLQILLKPEPVQIDEAVLFPCPLLSRHVSADPTAWLRSLDESTLADSADRPRIVLAHGSVHGFESVPDDEDVSAGLPNLIDLDRLPPDPFDYIALGDWHGTKQIGPKAWYAGTPEPDRFPKGDTNEPGHVLAVTLERSQVPVVESIRTARLGWRQLDFNFASDADLEKLESDLTQILGTRAGSDLLRLTLRGSLGIEATTHLEQLLESWQARLLRLKLTNESVIAPTDEEIEALTGRAGDPLISRVASQLVEQATGGGADDNADAATARTALRELHAAVNRFA